MNDLREQGRTVSGYEFADLARYNSERARGIIHTDEWVARMAAEQERFDTRHHDELLAAGGRELEAGVWLVPDSPRWWRRLWRRAGP